MKTKIVACAIIDGVLYTFTDAESFRKFSMENHKGYHAWINEHIGQGFHPTQDPLYKIIWGDGWYAIKDREYDGYWVAPKNFYDNHDYCPCCLSDFVENVTDELQEFVDSYCDSDALCILPKDFESTMESFIAHIKFGCNEEADKILKENGFEVISS